MDPYDYYYEESSSRGYPNTYQEGRYEPRCAPPRTYPCYSSQHHYDGHAASQGYEPSQSYRAPHPGYGYGTRDYNESSYYNPSPPYYNSSPPDYYDAPQPDYYHPQPSKFYSPPHPPTTVDPLKRHREILASTNESLASLSSSIDEFRSWGLIPIPSVLQATLKKFDSSAVTFLDLDLSQVPFARYRSLSVSIIKASTRIEIELKTMVERFISLRNMGFTIVYDGTQPLDTSDDFDELVVKEIPVMDDVGLPSTMPNSPFEKLEEEVRFIEYFVEDFILEEVNDVVLGVGESRKIQSDREDNILEEVNPRECELGDVESPLEEIEPIVEDVHFPLEEITEPAHDVIEAPVLKNDDLATPELPSSPNSLTGIGCDFEAVPLESTSTCSTDMFIFPEVDVVALLRKELILLLACVDVRARHHKNIATRVAYSRLDANVPSLPILESTKAWYERHYFLDPG